MTILQPPITTAMKQNPDQASPEAIDAAVEAWSEAVQAARRLGPMATVRFADGAINAAVRFCCGSWESFSRAVAVCEPPRVQRQFIGRYSSIFDNRIVPPKACLMRLLGRDADADTVVVRTSRPVRYPALLDPSELQARIDQLQSAR